MLKVHSIPTPADTWNVETFPLKFTGTFLWPAPNYVNYSGRCREVAEVSVKSTECADEVPR